MTQGIFPLSQENDPPAVGIVEPVEWEIRGEDHAGIGYLPSTALAILTL